MSFVESDEQLGVLSEHSLCNALCGSILFPFPEDFDSCLMEC